MTESQAQEKQGRAARPAQAKSLRFEAREREEGESGEPSKASEFKAKRDKASDEARDLAFQNKELIQRFKQCLSEAQDEKRARDDENDCVKKILEEKRVLEKQISDFKKQAGDKQRELGGFDEFRGDPMRVQAQIEELEWIQQTEALSAQRERELSKKISELRAKLPKTERAVALFKELMELRKKLRELVEKSRGLSDAIKAHSEASDAHHAKRIKLFQKADSIQKKISVALKEVDEKRVEARQQHKEFVDTVRGLKRAEASESKKELAQKFSFEKKMRAKIGERARKLFEEFKAGKTLTMDEIMVLREADII